MNKVLVCDDEKKIRETFYDYLSAKGFDVTLAENGKEAVEKVRNDYYDIVVLDVMMPKIDGYELMEYAANLGLPVIFLTALGSTQNKVKGLRMGADDYLAKPFEIVELLARVEAVLRRYNKSEQIIEIFDVVIDTLSRTVIQNGRQVSLTIKEFELLLLFVRNRNIALYRDTIYENVWQGEYTEQSRTVDLHVQRLKKKLHWEEHITAVYKVGYRLED